MSTHISASFGDTQSLFFVDDVVMMTQPESQDNTVDLTGLISRTDIFVNRQNFILSSDGCTDIRILNTNNKICMIIPLAGRSVVQLTLNAFFENIQKKAANKQRGGVAADENTECSFQCLLSDGTVWNHFYSGGKVNKSGIVQKHIAFEVFFSVVEGLPLVQHLLTASTVGPINSTDFILFFLSKQNEVCSIESYKKNKATWKRQFISTDLGTSTLIPQQYSNRGVTFIVRGGRVEALNPTDAVHIPAYIAQLEDVVQLETTAHLFHGTMSFFALTADGRLHVVLPIQGWLEEFHAEMFSYFADDAPIASSPPNRFSRIHVLSFIGFKTMLVGETVAGQFVKIYDFASRFQIPSELIEKPSISTSIGDLPVHYVSVSSSYFIQPDQTVVFIELLNGQSTLRLTNHRNAVSIASGCNHLLVLHADGTVSGELIGSPDENFNQHIVPIGLTSVVAISCGEWMSYALRSDGTVVAWGRNDQDQVAPANYLRNIVSVHGGRHHALFLNEKNHVTRIGSAMCNDGVTEPQYTDGMMKLHSADICAVGITTDHTVMDLFMRDGVVLTQDPAVVDVVATRGLYALLYSNGRVVILQRRVYHDINDDPLYTDAVSLAGISAIYANGDGLTCVGFDGRPYGLSSGEQFGVLPEVDTFPDSLRVKVWPGLSTQPEDYDADACHVANTLALRLGAIKQNHAYMNAPKLPVF
jgi:hypothetical protein